MTHSGECFAQLKKRFDDRYGGVIDPQRIANHQCARPDQGVVFAKLHSSRSYRLLRIYPGSLAANPYFRRPLAQHIFLRSLSAEFVSQPNEGRFLNAISCNNENATI